MQLQSLSDTHGPTLHHQPNKINTNGINQMKWENRIQANACRLSKTPPFRIPLNTSKRSVKLNS